MEDGGGEGGVRGAGCDADEAGEGPAEVVEGAAQGGVLRCHGV